MSELFAKIFNFSGKNLNRDNNFFVILDNVVLIKTKKVENSNSENRKEGY